MPYKIKENILFSVEKLLPVTDYMDYFVKLIDKTSSYSKKSGAQITRRSLPKIDSMLEWGVVKDGDTIIAKGKGDEAVLLNNGNVIVDGGEKSMQSWLKDLYGWSSIQTYVFAVHKETGKLLSELREEYMEKQEEIKQVNE